MRAWAALPTLHIAGLRAIVRVNTRNSGFTCEQRTTARHWCAQNADHFATSSPLSAFFTEVVCGLGTTPPQVAASSPPIGGNDAIQGSVRPRRCRPRATNRGNCTTRGSDTPATRRRRASCSAKPPSQPARSTPHRLQVLGTAPVGAKKFAQHRPSGGSSAKKLARHAQKRRIWGVVSARGELFRAFTI